MTFVLSSHAMNFCKRIKTGVETSFCSSVLSPWSVLTQLPAMLWPLMWSTNNATCRGCIPRLSTHINISAGPSHSPLGQKFSVSVSTLRWVEPAVVRTHQTSAPSTHRQHDCVPSCWERSNLGWKMWKVDTRHLSCVKVGCFNLFTRTINIWQRLI